MKIKATCKRCRRDLLLEQVVANGGVCPWDGEPFNADYTLAVVDAIRAAGSAGTELERALEALADLRPAFTVEASSVVDDLKRSIERLEQNLITQG